MITFDALLFTIGNWTIIQLPEDASGKLSSRGQVFTHGTINRQNFQQVIEPDGRWGHWFKVDASLQNKLGVTVGDTVTVAVEQSKDWPEPKIPKDFSDALAKAPSKVKDLWRTITPMARWEWIRWVNATNVTETRSRRVEVSI